MEKFLIRFTSIFLILYIVAIIIFKQNYNTYTYYINALFIGGFFLYYLIKQENYFKINRMIYAYAVFVIIATVSSLYGIEFYGTAFKSLQLLLILINMIVIYNIINKFNADYIFLNGILIGSFINYLLILDIVKAPFDIIMLGGGNRVMGTLGNPNVLALVMLISILVSIIYLRRKIGKLFYYYQFINILLAYYTILLTVSKKGVLFGSFLIFIFFIVQLKEPKKILKILAIIILLLFVTFQYVSVDILTPVFDNIALRFGGFESQMSQGGSSGSTGERKYLIKQGLNIFQDRPLFGYGLGNFSSLNKLGVYAHNNYVELLVGVGLIGTLVYYSIYYLIYKKVFYMKDDILKIIIIFFLLILLFMDMAVVSYGTKYLLYTLVFLYLFAENNSNDMEKQK